MLTQVQRVALHSLPVTPNGLKQFASSERGHTRIFGFWSRVLPLWGLPIGEEVGAGLAEGWLSFMPCWML